MKLLITPQDQFLRMLYSEKEPVPGSANSWFALSDGDKEAELFIYDFIGLYGVEAREFVKTVKGLKGKNLTVRLNTPGGQVFDGIAIYNALREHDAEVKIIIDGLAASAGSLIAMAGKTIVMNQGSRMMIHEAWGLTVGDAEDHRFSADRLDEVSADLAGIYSMRTGNSRRGVRQMMKAETWMNDKQAVEKGFADEVSGQESKDQASYRVPEGMYKNLGPLGDPEGKAKDESIQRNRNTEDIIASKGKVRLNWEENAVLPEVSNKPVDSVPVVNVQLLERQLALAMVD